MLGLDLDPAQIRLQHRVIVIEQPAVAIRAEEQVAPIARVGRPSLVGVCIEALERKGWTPASALVDLAVGLVVPKSFALTKSVSRDLVTSNPIIGER